MREKGSSPATVVVVVEGGREVTVGRLAARPPDLALVDALATLQLAARRRGWSVRLRDASEELRGLLELVGLAGVLALEAPRQPEVVEQLGIEEVMEPGDAPA